MHAGRMSEEIPAIVKKVMGRRRGRGRLGGIGKEKQSLDDLVLWMRSLGKSRYRDVDLPWGH